jgi:hypothetical protein
MTIEQRTLIPLADITAIEFECGHCHATYSIPLVGMNVNEMTFSCVNCPQEFANTRHTDSGKITDLQALQGLLARLKEVQERTYKAKIRLITAIAPTSGRGVSRDSGDGT